MESLSGCEMRGEGAFTTVGVKQLFMKHFAENFPYWGIKCTGRGTCPPIAERTGSRALLSCANYTSGVMIGA
jgi:hypothetical protein